MTLIATLLTNVLDCFKMQRDNKAKMVKTYIPGKDGQNKLNKSVNKGNGLTIYNANNIYSVR